MKNINDAIVTRLNKLMGERNLTQYRLAELSEIPYPTMKSIMQRRTKDIELSTVVLLSKGLNIKPCELIDDNSFLPENLDLEIYMNKKR